MKSKKLLIIAPAFLLVGSIVGCNKNTKVEHDPYWFKRDNWYELTSNARSEDIGKTSVMKVNGYKHLVRLIDIDHDVDENGNKIHTTWEFADLLSDENGFSLAYQWNDSNDAVTANNDYTNSTMRYALNGEGNNCGKELDPTRKGQILVAQGKGESPSTWTNEKYNVPVISMLPKEVSNNIKKTKKSVGVKWGGEYYETSFNDKLFLLSSIEMNNTGDNVKLDKGFGTVYKYYENKTSPTDFVKLGAYYRVHGATPSIGNGPIEAGSGQTYNGAVKNRAGQCEGMFTSYGADYWLRSPYDAGTGKNNGKLSLYCNYSGSFDNDECDVVYENALSIAPAFCI